MNWLNSSLGIQHSLMWTTIQTCMSKNLHIWWIAERGHPPWYHHSPSWTEQSQTYMIELNIGQKQWSKLCMAIHVFVCSTLVTFTFILPRYIIFISNYPNWNPTFISNVLKNNVNNFIQVKNRQSELLSIDPHFFNDLSFALPSLSSTLKNLDD